MRFVPRCALAAADVTVRGDFGRVEGDEVLLRQAMSNLCEMRSKRAIRPRSFRKLRSKGSRDAVHAVQRISVTDNGPGVPNNVADRVFRPFFTTKAHGTGLGLALVQKIIVTHNGRVTAGNDDGGGARFVVTLPASVTPERAAPAATR